MERPTRLELATSTLARWRSTRWATAAYSMWRPGVLLPATSIIIPQAGAVVNTQSAFFAIFGAKDRHSALHRAICNFRHLCVTSSDVRWLFNFVQVPPHWCRNSRGLYCVRRWLYSIWFGRGWSILNRLVSWIWNTKVSKEISRWCYNFWTCFYISYRETYMYFCWRFPWFCPFFEIWYMVIAVFIAAWILLWIACKYITYRPKG